jgi:hypothetical protein
VQGSRIKTTILYNSSLSILCIFKIYCIKFVSDFKILNNNKMYLSKLFSHLVSLELTCHTLINPSLNPANNFLPKAFHVKDVHLGVFPLSFPPSLSFFCTSGSSVAIGLAYVSIKSQILISLSVPAATHCNFGLIAI